jgi:antitoxin HicB
MKNDVRAQVEDYLNQEYTFIMEPHFDNGKLYYSMRVLEFEGCITTSENIGEVVVDIQDAMREWIQLNLKLGRPIPRPLRSRQYSGKIMLRMPPSLHESLMVKAAAQGISLNQYLVTSLSRTLGYEQGFDVCLTSEREKVRSH